MSRSEIGPPKSPENENLQVNFYTFIEKAYPTTTPKIRRLVTKLVAPLAHNDVKVIVRGGGIRAMTLDDAQKQIAFSEVFKKIPDYSLIGNAHPSISAVANEAYNPIRDLDIRLFARKKSNFTNQTKANIISLGFSQDPSGKFNTFYNAEFKIIVEENNQTTNQFFINIFRRDDNSMVFRLDIGDLPRDYDELSKNSRYSHYASDIDQACLGFLSNSNKGLTLKYNKTPDHSNKSTFMDRILDFSYRTVFNSRLSVFLPSLARNIGFRSSLLLDSNMIDLPLYKMWNHIRAGYGKKSPFTLDFVNKIIKFESVELDHKRVTILSDILSALTVNPIFSLPALYLTTDIGWTPLGQLINDDETMQLIMFNMALQIGSIHNYSSISDLSKDYYQKVIKDNRPELLGPIMIIRALKSLGILEQSIEESISNFLCLIDPLLLPNNDWKKYLEHQSKVGYVTTEAIGVPFSLSQTSL